jgi:YVTN family beta-propeller protein
VSVLDERSGATIAAIPVGKRPWGITVSRDGRFVYTANGLSNDVSVIDASALRVVATLEVGQRPWGVALSH